MKTILALSIVSTFASTLCAQNLVLPDNHYLGESATQAETLGSVNWWGTTAARHRELHVVVTGIPSLILGWETFLTLSPTFTGTLPLVIPHSWLGAVISGQAIGIDLTGGPNLVAWSSNTVRWVVGLD